MRVFCLAAALAMTTACASTVESNSVVADALPETSALNYLQSVAEKYPVDNRLGSELQRCEITETGVNATRERLFSRGWKVAKTYPFDRSEYLYLNGALFVGDTFEITDKDKVLPNGYSNKWCYLYAGRLVPDNEKDEIAKKVATALEALGVEKKR